MIHKKLKTDSNQSESSFFSQFSSAQIFKAWESSRTVLELAQKLGLNQSETLARIDYEYIKKIKTRDTWVAELATTWQDERDRYVFIAELSAEDLQAAMECEAIQTLSHLALHFLVSARHGKDKVRARIIELGLPVKSGLHKGVFGLSKTPIFWPTRFYEKRLGPKPMVCNFCSFKAINSRQIELHHPIDIDAGPRGARNSIYFRSQVEPICANCHSLEHRTGEKLRDKCGQWRRKLPGWKKKTKSIKIQVIFFH